MMDKDSTIKQIVADLIQIDPTLDAATLTPIVNKLLAEKPVAVLDEKFRSDLNQRLLLEISKLRDKKDPIIKYNFMKRISYGITALAAVAIVALIVVTLPKGKNTNILLGQKQVTKVGDNAFGSLNSLTLAQGGRGQGGGGNAAADSSTLNMTPPMATEPGMGMGGGTMDSRLYVPVNYKFVYKGEAFTIDQDKLPVYERQKGFGSATDLSSLLQNFNVSMFDVSKFANARVDYITATQDMDHGYTLSLDFREGVASIGQNWERWGMPSTVTPLTADQMPADEVLIDTANKFLTDFGIDRSGYGAPEIQNDWRALYADSTNKSLVYVPDQVSVIYPIKIEGNDVYDQGGTKSGMYVNVDVRSNQVSSVSELNSQMYNSSDYATEKDSDRILKLAENGGFQSYYPMMDAPNSKTEEVDLGKPTLSYVRLWLTVGTQTKDVYVPSLIFPVTSTNPNIYVKKIIVPVIKDVLDAPSNNIIPPIKAME